MTIYKAPFVCPKCGGTLQIRVISELRTRKVVDEETGKLWMEDEIALDEVDRTLECEACEEVFNYLHDDDGNVIEFNDDLF